MGPGLYIHVPFCAGKCAYCDFYSRPDAADPAVARWLDGLVREAARAPDGFVPRTIFIGGGTPTILPPAVLRGLFDRLHRAFDLSAVDEWTVEANPGTLTPERLDILRAGGADRLSLGAQSFDPALLRALGRRHDADDIAAAARAARAAGFRRLNLDLLYALPAPYAGTLGRTLDAALALRPDHLSAYALTLEPGTPLAAQHAAGAWPAVSDDDALAQFQRVRAALTEGGFEHYEISNFATPGEECRHNLLYWSGGEYLGLGPAAHSHWGGARWGNPPDLDAWASALEAGRSPRAFEERLEPAARARETLVFGLRRLAGVRRAEFRAHTGFDYEELRGPEIRGLLERGLLERTPDDGLRLSDAALFVSDSVFAELV